MTTQTAMVGHNGAPPTDIDFIEWLIDLLGSPMTAAEKVVTLAAIVLQTASNDSLAQACKIDRRTVMRSKGKPARDGWLGVSVADGGGRGNVQKFWPLHPTHGRVNFTAMDAVKGGQIATLFLGKGGNKGGQIAPVSEKGGRNDPLSCPKGGNNEPLSSPKGGQIAPVEPATQTPPIIDSRAQAQMESPLEILPIQGKKEREWETRLERDPAPHMNGIGFVISERHKLIIPLAIVENWKRRFTAIPDLEAQMQRLASYILRGGIMHAGWNCPDGWMAGLLAKDNQRCIDDAKVTDAKVNAVSRKASGTPAHMRRY